MYYVPSTVFGVDESFDDFDWTKSYAESVDKTLFEKKLAQLRNDFLYSKRDPTEAWILVQARRRPHKSKKPPTRRHFNNQKVKNGTVQRRIPTRFASSGVPNRENKPTRAPEVIACPTASPISPVSAVAAKPEAKMKLVSQFAPVSVAIVPVPLVAEDASMPLVAATAPVNTDILAYPSIVADCVVPGVTTSCIALTKVCETVLSNSPSLNHLSTSTNTGFEEGNCDDQKAQRCPLPRKASLCVTITSTVLLLYHLISSSMVSLWEYVPTVRPAMKKGPNKPIYTRSSRSLLRMLFLSLVLMVNVHAGPTALSTTGNLTVSPTEAPTTAPSGPSRKPSAVPTYATTAVPTTLPTAMPTGLAISPHTLRCTRSVQHFIVPTYVTSLTVTLYGGSGGHASDNNHGRGGIISSVIPVTPGEVLMVMVGSAGSSEGSGTPSGGYNGGGKGGNAGGWLAGGGGATDIRRSPYTLADRVLIAGGGGGRGYHSLNTFGGNAGVEATSGTPYEVTATDYGRAGGEVLEEPTCSGLPRSPGPLGLGCNAQGYEGGGGGGGGYYGGGAGPNQGGGGGGSSYSLYSVINQGYHLGDGYAVIEWDWAGPSYAPTPALPTIAPSGPSRKPSAAPTTTCEPTNNPTRVPSLRVVPTATPTLIAASPHILRYTGTEQNFVVPANVTSLKVTLYGGSGGNGYNERFNNIADIDFVPNGGRGGMISSIIPVIPGEVLIVTVGSVGDKLESFNGGGRGGNYGGAAGGGATDVRRIPYTLADRILIAGGGGGGGGYYIDSYGGDGGVEATSGVLVDKNPMREDYGRAGGEVLEESTCSGQPGSPGPLGQGCNSNYYAGGGGGGYYGGGGGYDSGGGGGGSSYSLHGVVDHGYNVGNGYAVIEWNWEGPTTAPTVVPTTTSAPTFLLSAPVTLRYIGDVQTFYVPPKVTSITVTLYAGSGQNRGAALGGRGAMIRSSIPVTPGEALLVVVGSSGEYSYNGGGQGSSRKGYGGGATDIRRTPFAQKDRIIVAGGGGGAGDATNADGGDGGVHAADGKAGSRALYRNDFGKGAGDKLQEPICTGDIDVPGSPGGLGMGCSGREGYCGAGGGGYYGGGAGYYYGGGGGGSSYSQYDIIATGFNVGDGYAVIEWDLVDPSPAPSNSPTASVVPTSSLFCPNGTILLANTCAICPAGTYAVAGFEKCVACPEGNFSAAWSAACDECPAGHYCAKGSATPMTCPGGTASAAGAAACAICPAGTYSGTTATECTPCPAGHYCAQSAAPPILCGAGSVSAIGATTCTPCANGEYSYPGTSVCLSCSA